VSSSLSKSLIAKSNLSTTGKWCRFLHRTSADGIHAHNVTVFTVTFYPSTCCSVLLFDFPFASAITQHIESDMQAACYGLERVNF